MKLFVTFSEATDFRDWCENECVRLIGSKGMSIVKTYLSWTF